MLVKAVLTALLCVARASVIVNIYDEDEDATTNDITIEDSCNLRWCEMTCWQTGFNGGVCIGDKCKCDIMNPNDAKKNDITISCNLRWCEMTCRQMGFSGGVCIGDKCKCDIMKPSEMITNDISNAASCDQSWCETTCRRLGYKGGVCIGNDCTCVNFNALEVSRHLVNKGCTPSACDQTCRRFGYPGGYCSEDRCQCNDTKNFARAVRAHESSFHGGICMDYICNEQCQRIGYLFGSCLGDSCKCSEHSEPKEITDNAIPEDFSEQKYVKT